MVYINTTTKINKENKMAQEVYIVGTGLKTGHLITTRPELVDRKLIKLFVDSIISDKMSAIGLYRGNDGTLYLESSEVLDAKTTTLSYLVEAYPNEESYLRCKVVGYTSIKMDVDFITDLLYRAMKALGVTKGYTIRLAGDTAVLYVVRDIQLIEG